MPAVGPIQPLIEPPKALAPFALALSHFKFDGPFGQPELTYVNLLS